MHRFNSGSKEASNNVSKITFNVEFIFVPKQECKINTLFVGDDVILLQLFFHQVLWENLDLK